MPKSEKQTDPTASDIEELVAFFPSLSAPGFKPIIDWGGGEKDAEGSYVMPWPNYEAVVVEFFRQAGAGCWTDYDYEPAEAGRMLEDEELIKTADLAQIRTMLTYCVRGERFCDGHWGAMIKGGARAAAPGEAEGDRLGTCARRRARGPAARRRRRELRGGGRREKESSSRCTRPKPFARKPVADLAVNQSSQSQ